MSIISAGTSNTTSLVYTGDTTGAMVFQTNGTNERMRISSGGNVGINDANPGYKLSVGGSGTFYGIEFGESNFNGIRVGSGNDYYWEMSREGISSGHLSFFNKNGGAVIERMRINSDGNLGVGITDSNPMENGGTFRNILLGNGAGYGAFQGVSTATASGSTLAAFSGGTTGASGRKAAGSINVELDGTSTTNAVGRIAFYTSIGGDTIERMRINSVGYVTTPYQPAFMQVNLTGYNSVGYLKGTGSTYNFNRGNHYNSTNGRFTAPISGTYMFVCGILVESGSGRLEGFISINGIGRANFNGTGSTYDGPTASAVFDLNAGDYVDVRRQSGTAHSDGSHPNTYFGGYLLG